MCGFEKGRLDKSSMIADVHCRFSYMAKRRRASVFCVLLLSAWVVILLFSCCGNEGIETFAGEVSYRGICSQNK